MTDKTFLKPAEFYQREIDPINQYIEQTSFYLSKMKDRSIEDCRKALLLRLKDKKVSTFNDPIVHYMERDDSKDTFRTTNKLSYYIEKYS